MRKRNRKKGLIRLGPEYAILMLTRFSEKRKPSKKLYKRNCKHRKTGADFE